MQSDLPPPLLEIRQSIPCRLLHRPKGQPQNFLLFLRVIVEVIHCLLARTGVAFHQLRMRGNRGRFQAVCRVNYVG